MRPGSPGRPSFIFPNMERTSETRRRTPARRSTTTMPMLLTMARCGFSRWAASLRRPIIITISKWSPMSSAFQRSRASASRWLSPFGPSTLSRSRRRPPFAFGGWSQLSFRRSSMSLIGFLMATASIARTGPWGSILLPRAGRLPAGF